MNGEVVDPATAVLRLDTTMRRIEVLLKRIAVALEERNPPNIHDIGRTPADPPL